MPFRSQRILLKLVTLSFVTGLFFLFPSSVYNAQSRHGVHLKNSVNLILDEAVLNHLQARSQTFNHDVFLKTISLQRSLACFSEGSWIPKQYPYNIRQPNRRVKAPAYIFKSSCPPAISKNTSLAAELCSSLASMQVLFVGPETTFYLHSLWLNALEAHENRSLPCLGPAFCTFHHICQAPSSQVLRDAEERFKKFPRKEDLAATGSSILRYALSTTLLTIDDAENIEYVRPVIDSRTGVRVRNTYWIAHARRAHVIVMNSGPLPAPTWSYTSNSFDGNWSFANQLYLNSSTAYLDDDNNLLPIRVVNAALHVTLTTFLPTILHSLQVLKTNPIIRQKILIWHGSWYLQSQCSSDEGLWKPQQLLIEDVLNLPYNIDPWSLYYNAQVYMQNRLMRDLLPHYGIVFFPQEIPMIPKKPDKVNHPRNRYHATNCLIYPPSSSYGKAMGDMFLGGLLQLTRETRSAYMP